MQCKGGSRGPGWAPLLALCLLAGGLPPAAPAAAGEGDEHGHHHAVGAAHARYTCPMHPQVSAEEPGRCPICGMNLARAPDGDEQAAAPAADSLATVRITSRAAQVLGLRTAPVEARVIAERVATWARVVADGDNERVVSAPAGGWVRALHVTEVGAQVIDGAPLFDLYSPELQQRQRDYIDTLNRRDQMLATLSSLEGQNGQLLASLARERKRQRDALLELGIARASLDDIERLRRVRDGLTVVAGGSGQLTSLEARVGQAVAPGEALYRLVDTRHVVLQVMMSPGQRASLRAPVELYVEDGEVPQPVSLDEVVFDPRAQGYGLRAVAAGLGARLPGEVLAVTLRGASVSLPAVPRSAVIADGTGAFVVIAGKRSAYQLRRVHAAVRDDAWVGVERGLAPGEQVVIDGQYLLDAAATLSSSFDPAGEH